MDMAFSATISSSAVASSQLDFWYENVVNPMPATIASKLSPLSSQDSVFDSLFASSTSNEAFCSEANLACTPLPKSTIGKLKALLNGYLLVKSIHSYVHDHYSSSLDPNFFFTISSVLQKGKRIRLPNFKDETLPPRSFLPFHISSKISTNSSADLQKIFPSLYSSQPTKEFIEKITSHCSSASLRGEMNKCSNSLEDMLRFSKKALGATKLLALTTKSVKGSGKVLEIRNIELFPAEKMVSCHEIFFPFAAYFCHSLSSSETRLYAVDFIDPSTKAPVNKILAVCHMDTSQMQADHEALKHLKLTPGQGEKPVTIGGNPTLSNVAIDVAKKTTIDDAENLVSSTVPVAKSRLQVVPDGEASLSLDVDATALVAVAEPQLQDVAAGEESSNPTPSTIVVIDASDDTLPRLQEKDAAVSVVPLNQPSDDHRSMDVAAATESSPCLQNIDGSLQQLNSTEAVTANKKFVAQHTFSSQIDIPSSSDFAAAVDSPLVSNDTINNGGKNSSSERRESPVETLWPLAVQRNPTPSTQPSPKAQAVQCNVVGAVEKQQSSNLIDTARNGSASSPERSRRSVSPAAEEIPQKLIVTTDIDIP
ncbi:OLC1v1007976C1 [Oldenlandia corymbosa var. corymbosa]|nr:OLC1v1007976C1 [Oldenlandia corymbosa var. corymbosa]